MFQLYSSERPSWCFTIFILQLVSFAALVKTCTGITYFLDLQHLPSLLHECQLHDIHCRDWVQSVNRVTWVQKSFLPEFLPSHLSWQNGSLLIWTGLYFLPLLAHALLPYGTGSMGVVISPTRWKASRQRPYTVTCDIPVPRRRLANNRCSAKVCLMEHFPNVGHFSHLQDFCHIYLHFPLSQLTFKILIKEEK